MYYVCMGMEIGENMAEDDKIINAKKELQKVFDSLIEGIIIIDRNFRVIRLNRAWLNMAGKEKYEDVLGQKCFTAMHGRKDICPDCVALEVFRSGQSEFKETKTLLPNGEARISLNRALPWRQNDDGEVTSVINIVTDITEERRSHSKRAHDEKIKALGHLAGASAHEINQPLGVIIGRSQLLLSNLLPDNPQYEKLIQNISEIAIQAERINHIVKQLTSVIDHVTKPYVNGEEILDLEKSSGNENE